MLNQWLSFFFKFLIGFVLVRITAMSLGIAYWYYGLSEWDTILYMGIFTYGLFYVYSQLHSA